MILSKADHKCRMKFIQENHYDKAEQKYFDNAKAIIGLTYKELYMAYRRGDIFYFMYDISVKRVGKVMSKLGVSAQQVTEAFSAFGRALAESEVIPI